MQIQLVWLNGTTRHTTKNVFPFAITNKNVPRFRPYGPVGGRLPPLQWGGTIIRVVPFTRTGYTSKVAGGRLPPLRYICSELPYFQRVYRCFASVKCKNVVHYRRGGNLPPATLQIQPVRAKRHHPPTCHSEGAKASRGIFPSGKLYLVLVILATWWISPLR